MRGHPDKRTSVGGEEGECAVSTLSLDAHVPPSYAETLLAIHHLTDII